MQTNTLGKRNRNAYPVPGASVVLGIRVPEAKERYGLDERQLFCAPVQIIEALLLSEKREPLSI